MPYERLLENGQIERIDADPSGAQRKLARARRHLAAAEKLLEEDEFPDVAYQTTYNAGEVALEALMLAEGYRKKSGEGAHIAVINFARECLGEEYEREVESVASMRRRRHNLQYGTREREVTPLVARRRIETIRRLADGIEERITGQSRLDSEDEA